MGCGLLQRLEDKSMRWLQKASYSIEAAIYVPIVLFVLFNSISIGINFWQQSMSRSINEHLKDLDVVKEFYMYQIADEVVGDVVNDR